MSDLSLFLKANKKTKENEKYAVTKSICDENGNPVEWEFKHINSKKVEEIKDNATTSKTLNGKFVSETDTNKFVADLIVECSVYPDLHSAELQDSYGVRKAEDLVYELVDDPGEFNRLSDWLYRFLGFSEGLDEKVSAAKN